MNRKWLFGVTLVLAATVIVSSGTFSAMSADRYFQTTVSEDENAYLGIETVETSGNLTTNEIFSLLNLSDNSASGIDTLEIEIKNGPVTLESGQALKPPATVNVQCTENAKDKQVEVQISATGEKIDIDKTKTVSVTCTS